MTSCCLLTFEYKLDFYNTWHWVIVWDRVGSLLIFFFPLLHGMWDIIPWPGIKTVPLESEAWSLNLWTTWSACLWVLRHYLISTFLPPHKSTNWQYVLAAIHFYPKLWHLKHFPTTHCYIWSSQFFFISFYFSQFHYLY